jgi:hypothetical protein
LWSAISCEACSTRLDEGKGIVLSFAVQRHFVPASSVFLCARLDSKLSSLTLVGSVPAEFAALVVRGYKR